MSTYKAVNTEWTVSPLYVDPNYEGLDSLHPFHHNEIIEEEIKKKMAMSTSKFKITKLPAGQPGDHETFMPSVAASRVPRRGVQKVQTDEELKEQKLKEMMNKEQKLSINLAEELESQ